MVEKNAKIYVAGHRGMVGSAIVRHLQQLGYSNIITRSSKEVDLRNQQQVFSFFEKEKPDYVFMAAARVGGIYANNTYRAEFLYDNLMIESNVIHASYLNKCKKLLFLGLFLYLSENGPTAIKGVLFAYRYAGIYQRTVCDC